MIVQRGVASEYAFQAAPGSTPGILVANLPFGSGYQLARTTLGITEIDPGQYVAVLPAFLSSDTYAIVVDDGAGHYAAENLEVTDDGLPPTRTAGGAGKLVVSATSYPGLVGTIGIRFRDTPGTTIVGARTTAGITEYATTGIYAWVGSYPDVVGTVTAVWDTGGASPVYGEEGLVLAAAVADVVAAVLLVARVWVDDVTLFDAADPDPVVVLTTDSRRGLLSTAKPRDEAENRLDDDGAIDVTSRYEPRVFDPFAGKIRAPDYGTLLLWKERLGELFSLGALHTLGWELGDGSTRTVLVRAMSELAVDTIGNSSHAAWSIQLFASDPLLVSATVKSATLDPFATAVSGLTFPLFFPLALGGSSSATVTLRNGGTRNAKPVYIFEGPWDDPFVENTSTGERFQTVGLSLAAGEFAVVDTAARAFTRGGSSAADAVDWARSTGPWPFVPPGVSYLRVGGSPLTGALLQVDYRDTYV